MKTIGSNRMTGFSLVEVVIVVAVIGILATIVTLSYRAIVADSHNGQRNSSTIVIAEALESYYSKNGEYPGCATMQSDPSLLQSTLGIDKAVLKAPNATQDNSIICTDISPSTPADVYAYVGDGTPSCSAGGACRFWTLKYKFEGSNEIKSIQSRRTVAVALAPAAAASTTTTQLNGSNAVATATNITCSEGSPQYQVNLQVNDGSWSLGTWGLSTTRSQATAQGAKYAYRTDTRCVLADGTEGSPTTGAASSVVTSISRPAAPVLTASSTGTGVSDSITFTWPAVSCSVGTPKYSTAYYRDDDAGWRGWTADSTTSGVVQSTNYQGYEYRVKARAACSTAYASSPYSLDSNVPSYIRSVNKPGVATNFNAAVYDGAFSDANGYGTNTQYARWVGMSWTAPSCGLGTARFRQAATATINTNGGGTYYQLYSGGSSASENADVSRSIWLGNPLPLDSISWSSAFGLSGNPNNGNVEPTPDPQSLRWAMYSQPKSLGNGWNPPSAATQARSRAVVMYACYNPDTLRSSYMGNAIASPWVNY